MDMDLYKNMEKRGFVIAIDGYSSCGKSTFAKSIAVKLGYIFIDTGAMYRAVTLAAIRERALDCVAKVVDEQRLTEVLQRVDISFRFNESRGASDIYLGDECVEGEIRGMDVSGMVSRVSAVGVVREKLVRMQQMMGERGGVVMDGRDIGSVVFPDAEIKIFMTADPTVRAERRYAELRAKGEEITLEDIVKNVVERDRQDETRAISPLVRAEDALLLDNTYMSVEEQMEWFEGVLKKN